VVSDRGSGRYGGTGGKGREILQEQQEGLRVQIWVLVTDTTELTRRTELLAFGPRRVAPQASGSKFMQGGPTATKTPSSSLVWTHIQHHTRTASQVPPHAHMPETKSELPKRYCHRTRGAINSSSAHGGGNVGVVLGVEDGRGAETHFDLRSPIF